MSSIDQSIYQQIGDVTNPIKCVIHPDAIHVKWDHAEYDIIIVMKAVYAGREAPFNEYDEKCIKNYGQTFNTQFAALSLNLFRKPVRKITFYPSDVFYPTSRNIYFRYLNSIYVLPYQYISPTPPKDNHIVYMAQALKNEVKIVHDELADEPEFKMRCKEKSVDCGQTIVDQAFIKLISQNEGRMK